MPKSIISILFFLFTFFFSFLQGFGNKASECFSCQNRGGKKFIDIFNAFCKVKIREIVL